MRIPLSSVNLSRLERDYAKDAIDTGWISGTGGYLARFESALAQKLGRKHVIAVANGTVALELALLAQGVGPCDEVIVPALTFVAPAAAVRAVGAIPVFADITSESWTINPQHVRRLITDKTKAVIAVDVLGHPCEFDELLALGVPLIEDAAEAHGALYRGKPAGSFGVMSTFSFHANKTITTGEGGCVATDNDSLAKTMRLIANHGMTGERPYWHPVVGHNFRMTNVTAAIGLGQVERWDEMVAARNHVAGVYDELLGQSILKRRPVASWAREACWLYTVTATGREAILPFLRERGIDARAIWTALPDLPLYAESLRGDYSIAREVAGTAFWLPTWAHMPEEEITFVAESLVQHFSSTSTFAA
jgi:perosamine synthetase